MRVQLLSLFVVISIVSCSKEDETGFLGEWEGTTTVIIQGESVLSNTTATIKDLGDLQRECEVVSNGLNYKFDTEEVGDMLLYTKTEVKNPSDSLMKTYIKGSAELIGDTLLVFDHEVVTMQGSSVVSSSDYYLEFKRKE